MAPSFRDGDRSVQTDHWGSTMDSVPAGLIDTGSGPWWTRASSLTGSPGWRLLRSHARTFLVRQPVPLHRSALNAITAAYAWCRIADDIVDQAGEGRSFGCGTVPRSVGRRALPAPNTRSRSPSRWARRRYDIPLGPVLDLLRGMRQDLTPRAYADWDELREYCYCVAGTIGLIAAPVFGCREDRALVHAVDLGIAMQLTNILRDVAEDARLGRVYLPEADLRRFGVDPAAVMAGEPGGDIAGLMRMEIERARSLLPFRPAGYPVAVRLGSVDDDRDQPAL